MTPRKIIFASAHRYRGQMRLGTSYLAEAMAKRGWDVLFIEQPTSPLHLVHPAARETATDKWRKSLRSRGIRQDATLGDGTACAGSVTVLNVSTATPHVNFPLFRSNWTLRNWWRFTLPSIIGRIRRNGYDAASAMVFDSPFYFGLAQMLGCPSVYRYADRLDDFTEITPAMLRLQHSIFNEADLMIYTANALRRELSARAGPSLYLPNGVDIDAYSGEFDVPEQLAAIAKPRVIYSGTVGPWFDVDLVLTAAQQLREVNFVIMGKILAHRDKLAAMPNIHVLGEVPFDQVPAFVSNCDAAIIPFDIRRMPGLVEAINPLKVYEYCAVGAPVVSYASAEMSLIGAPVATYVTTEEFIAELRRAIKTPDPERKRIRQEWAAQASWSIRAETLERAIEGLGEPMRHSVAHPAISR